VVVKSIESPTAFLSAIVILVLLGAEASTQDGKAEYTLPPESVQEFFDRDKNYATLDTMSPDGEHFLVPLVSELSTLEKMSERTYRLAMLELRPRVDREWRLDTCGIYGLRIYSLSTRRFTDVQLPNGILVSDMMWSPDGKRIAFLAHLPDVSQVWTADRDTGRARRLHEAPVMATLAARPSFRRPPTAPSRMLQWTPDGTILTLLVPSDRGPEPKKSRVPKSPIIRRTREEPAPTRTLPFLLRDAHDEALFRYYTAAQLAEISSSGPPRGIGSPAMYLEFSLSPDGRHVLAERLADPLSYIVSYSNFPRNLEIMTRDGDVLSTVREIPLQEDMTKRPEEIEADYPREVAWRPDGKGLGFLWREEKEDEEPSGDDERLDRIMLLVPPFDVATAESLVESSDRLSAASYSTDGRYAFAKVKSSGEDEDSARERIVAFDLSSPERRMQDLTPAYDPKDVLSLPGEVLTRASSNGTSFAFLSSDGTDAYLHGQGYKEDYRPQPFIDRVTISNGERQRVFEGSRELYELPLVPLDREMERLIIRRESVSDFPDSFLWNDGDTLENLTNNQDPFPLVTAAKRVDFEFTRRDGLTVQARISLPIGYREGTRVPAVFWTYPREYSSVEEYQNAALRRRNHNEFTHLSYLRWSDIWLSQGYALVYPDVPIIRKGKSYNDKFIQHLVDTLYAAIRKVDELGYVDVDRIGHGGHSYGAFATANLLANAPFFKAGIAGDGAYNRTLTPMGFQNEKRFVWEAEHVYLEMSPFFKADHIDTPLLMYHGADDNNSGTFPIQSERLMQALTGLGKTAVLYMYPFESHGPRAKETYLDLWARWLEWFDKHVKGNGKEPRETPTDQSH